MADSRNGTPKRSTRVMKEDTQIETPRRSTRIRKPTTKSVESVYIKCLTKSGLVGNISSTSSDSSSEDETFSEAEKMVATPTILSNLGQVQGGKIYSLNMRKLKKGMLKKASECNQTPQAQRTKIKKAIEEELLSDSEGDKEPYDESDSDYKHSQESDDESGEEESSSNSEDDVTKRITRNVKNLIIKSPSKTRNKQSRRKSDYSTEVFSHNDEESRSSADDQSTEKHIESSKNLKIVKTSSIQTRSKKYTIKTDEFFSNQSSKKNTTSDHTLDTLETPRLPQHVLQKLLRNMKLSKEHHKCVNELLKQKRLMFSKWLYLLHENFNVLVYGLGSKRTLLNDFQNEYLKGSPVIVINGFFPSLSIKDVLDGIIVDLLGLKKNPSNVFECCDIIKQEFNHIPNSHLYLIVHNIEGEMLRNGKAQNVLARLASIENIHLIASIDHINGPLIWDHAKLGKFNYTWWDLTTYLPYIDETSFESSMMIQKSGEFALSSLRNVFLSLTSNSKKIYLVIVKYQLEHSKSQHYEGLAFKDLYSSCREAFLVSSDLALRAQLTEFVDHKMVRFKRSLDGVEHLVIPIANVLLQKFVDEQGE